jgi:hypothetical protein
MNENLGLEQPKAECIIALMFLRFEEQQVRPRWSIFILFRLTSAGDCRLRVA